LCRHALQINLLKRARELRVSHADSAQLAWGFSFMFFAEIMRKSDLFIKKKLPSG
jgi:hypothetical protein